jgi:hypothetical protein
MTKTNILLSLLLFGLVAAAPVRRGLDQEPRAAKTFDPQYGLGEYASGQQQSNQRQVLADFRIDRTYRSPRITASTSKNVFSKVFRKYLTDDSSCSQDFEVSADDYLKAARDAGQIVPTIGDMATGSFTAAGLQQIAYVISVNECGASHADNYGSKRIAVFSGQQLVMDADADFLSSIVRKTDLNGDGIDELLMTSGDMNQGVAFEAASLISLQNRRLHVIQELGTVMEDSCASEMPGSVSKASVISVNSAAPGHMPKLRIDNYRSGCKVKRWRFVSTGKMH